MSASAGFMFMIRGMIGDVKAKGGKKRLRKPLPIQTGREKDTDMSKLSLSNFIFPKNLQSEDLYDIFIQKRERKPFSLCYYTTLIFTV